MSHGAIACIVVAVYFRRCVSGSMEHRRKWLSLCPVVSLCGVTDYDEVLKKIFAANLAITGDVLHAFLLSGYRVNVAASELEQWIYEARLHYARPLFGYDDLLRGCYNVQPTMDVFVSICGVLADSGVDCTIASMECWMLPQTPRKLDDRVLKPNVLVETRLQNALVESGTTTK